MQVMKTIIFIYCPFYLLSLPNLGLSLCKLAVISPYFWPCHTMTQTGTYPCIPSYHDSDRHISIHIVIIVLHIMTQKDTYPCNPSYHDSTRWTHTCTCTQHGLAASQYIELQAHTFHIIQSSKVGEDYVPFIPKSNQTLKKRKRKQQ